MKNGIVVNKEKGFTRYKIWNLRKFNKSKGMAVSGYTLFAYVYADKIRLVRLSWNNATSEKGNLWKDTTFITIKYKKGNFIYSRNGGRSSFSGLQKIFYTGKYLPKKTSLLRLQRIIKKWSESLGHTYKPVKEPTWDKILERLIWPSLQRIEYTKFNPSRIPKIGSLLRLHLTLKEIIRRLIGSCGRKTYKLVNTLLVDHRLDYVLQKLYVFKRLFGNIDDVQLALTKPIFTFIPVADTNTNYIHAVKTSHIIEYLKQFTKARLLTDSINELPTMMGEFLDCVRMWRQLDKPEIDRGITLKEHHDILALQQRKMETSDFSLKPSEDLISIDGLTVGDYKIVVPKTNYELIDWGNKMNNCIAGYAERMRMGDTHLFGIYQEDKLVYNIMLDSLRVFHKNDSWKEKTGLKYKCQQFYGKRNSRVEPEIVTKILSALPFKVDAGYYGVKESEDYEEEDDVFLQGLNAL